MESSSRFALPHPLFIAAFFCAVLYIVGIYCRPIFPVDETRYLTVAWEMFSTGDYILPHLNHQPYDHKPPLLFWSINALWHIFGVSQQVAMAVPFLYAFALAAATWRFARRLIPEDKNFATLATYALIGSMPFVVYSNMIMFDLVLAVFSVLGLTAIWDYAHTGKRKHLVIFALILGLGAITKGPVILLHTLFPVFCVRLWLPKEQRIVSTRAWVTGFILAVVVGFAIGLSWAIPAAIKGGPEFADKIFWGQTAGRVTNSFDHKHPVYWYLMFLPILLAPWVFSPLVWRGIKGIRETGQCKILSFLTVWVAPVFICFCLISGKQVHYLIPLVPGAAIFVALCLRRFDTVRLKDVAIPMAVTSLMMLVPVLAKFFILSNPPKDPGSHMLAIAAEVGITLPITLLFVSLVLFLVLGRKYLLPQILAMSLSSLLIMVSFEVEASQGYFRNYDLQPIARIIEKNPPVPLAFIRNYHGEWGFLARLHRPVKQMEPHELPDWFEENPNGMAFIRTSHLNELEPYDIIFRMPYRTDHVYAIAVKRGMAKHFVK